MSDLARMRCFTRTLALITVVAMLIFVAACSLPGSSLSTASTGTAHRGATPKTETSALYFFDAHVQLPPSGVVQPAQTLEVLWQPRFDQNQQVSGPAPDTCSVALLGPFASRAAALQAAQALHGGGPAVTPGAVVNIPLIDLPGSSLTIDGHDGVPHSSTVTLPKALGPGYYMFDAIATGLGGFAGSDQGGW